MKKRLQKLEQAIKRSDDDYCPRVIIHDPDEPEPKIHKGCKRCKNKVVVILPDNKRNPEITKIIKEKGSYCA